MSFVHTKDVLPGASHAPKDDIYAAIVLSPVRLDFQYMPSCLHFNRHDPGLANVFINTKSISQCDLV